MIPVSQMSEIEDRRLERRLERNTYLVIAVALLCALFWSSRPMALGILLGGALSLLNKRWLQGSVRAILSKAVVMQSGRVPPFTASKLILRYFVIALAFGIAFWTGDFHPLGVGIGFAAFVGGVMMEAGYQLYLSFKSNENTSQE
jgi:hypothetical protein